VQGRRTVAQLATYSAPDFPARGAVFAANGVVISGAGGGANPINGTDGSCGSTEPVPGLIATEPSGYTEVIGGSDPTGSPGKPTGYGNADAVIAATRINWPSLVAGNFTADYELPAGPVVWTGSPTVLIQGNYTLGAGLPNPAEGILVVTGNLTVGSGFHYHGVILVGGYLSSPGNAFIHGMLVTGLNISLGQVVPPDTFPRAQMQLFWRSCEYYPAIMSQAWLSPLGNAWVDTWSTY
jgi:hypothetical protein